MPRGQERMILISVHVPRKMLEGLDRLVERGVFPSRSEALRLALCDFLLSTGARRGAIHPTGSGLRRGRAAGNASSQAVHIRRPGSLPRSCGSGGESTPPRR